MKLFYVLVVLASAVAVHGQRTCYICSRSATFDGNPTSANHCYDNVTNVPTTSSSATNAYCAVTFTLDGGVPRTVNRLVTDPTGDIDPTSTTTIPSTPKCNYDFGTGVTTCGYACTTDRCNTVTTNSLVSCAADCVNGYCNYFTGTCTCNAHFTGSTCATSTITYRSCVQCSEEIDSDCATKTSGTQCALSNPTSEVFCVTKRSTIIDTSGNVVRSRITRGCTTTNEVQDQCTLNSVSDPIFTDFTEETCTSTCHTDNCNTGTPDGVLASTESSSLYCVQCTGTGPSSTCYTSTARTLCPNTANQCYSKIVYYYSAKADLRYRADPAVRFESIERSCRQSSTSVNSCTNATITGTNTQRVTCEESCTTDGCNDHWPARPKCSRCTTDRVTDINDGYDACLFNPPSAVTCPSPAHEYCTTSEIGREEDLLRRAFGSLQRTGYSHDITRECSYWDVGNGCNLTTINDVNYNVCNRTCMMDGCNQGNGSIAPTSQSTLALLLPALLAYFLQQFTQ